MTNACSMDHRESAKVHHDLSGRKAEHLNKYVARLLEFVCNRGNPFIVQAPLIKLHNFVNKQYTGDEESMRLLQVLANDGRYYKEFRNERFVKKYNLSVTNTKRNLPRLGDKATADPPVPSAVVSQKMLAAAQRGSDI